MSTTFEKARVGDKVFSHTFGWGVIEYINSNDNLYPIYVNFHDVVGLICRYSFKGYYDSDSGMQSLFWDEVVIEAPKKPKKYINIKVVNGIEIPNISFSPNPGEYCYSPVPIHPDLHRHLYYCFNEANEHLKNNGLCYPCTEEGKAAAILHATAMLKSN
jgi:hypothetical protein